MKKLCVFCGSSSGDNPSYVQAAKDLGHKMAKSNIGLVYGGASIGVMGSVANGCLENNGKVWGVIPQTIIDLEVGHQNLTQLITVNSMHERKQKMYDLSDAFLSLPGGFGTLDEMCEIITWAQLSYHKKPIYLYNQEGFYDYLLQHFNEASKRGFISEEHLKLLRVVDSFDGLISDLVNSNP